MGHFSKKASDLPQSNKNLKTAPKHNMFWLSPEAFPQKLTSSQSISRKKPLSKAFCGNTTLAEQT